MRKRRRRPNTISLPPRLPQNDQELKRVVMLLGDRKKTDLNPRARNELQTLLGIYPTAREASFWKRVLRRLCQEMVPQGEPSELPELPPSGGLAPRKCEACGSQFHCGVSSEGCWCFHLKLSPEALATVRRQYQSCLCSGCLARFTAGREPDSDRSGLTAQ